MCGNTEGGAREGWTGPHLSSLSILEHEKTGKISIMDHPTWPDCEITASMGKKRSAAHPCTDPPKHPCVGCGRPWCRGCQAGHPPATMVGKGHSHVIRTSRPSDPLKRRVSRAVHPEL